jgi:nucleoid DNA-binding protein
MHSKQISKFSHTQVCSACIFCTPKKEAKHALEPQTVRQVRITEQTKVQYTQSKFINPPV